MSLGATESQLVQELGGLARGGVPELGVLQAAHQVRNRFRFGGGGNKRMDPVRASRVNKPSSLHSGSRACSGNRGRRQGL